MKVKGVLFCFSSSPSPLPQKITEEYPPLPRPPAPAPAPAPAPPAPPAPAPLPATSTSTSDAKSFVLNSFSFFWYSDLLQAVEFSWIPFGYKNHLVTKIIIKKTSLYHPGKSINFLQTKIQPSKKIFYTYYELQNGLIVSEVERKRKVGVCEKGFLQKLDPWSTSILKHLPRTCFHSIKKGSLGSVEKAGSHQKERNGRGRCSLLLLHFAPNLCTPPKSGVDSPLPRYHKEVNSLPCMLSWWQEKSWGLKPLIFKIAANHQGRITIYIPNTPP